MRAGGELLDPGLLFPAGPIRDAVLVEGEPDGLADAVAQASDGQPWPSWDYGG